VITPMTDSNARQGLFLKVGT